jgi:hypothetical protein
LTPTRGLLGDVLHHGQGRVLRALPEIQAHKVAHRITLSLVVPLRL